MKTLPGAHDEGVKDNRAVNSKFDKSHGHGLKAPHLRHPGEVAKDTGSGHAGFSENGHMLPKHNKLPMTDGNVIKGSERISHSRLLGTEVKSSSDRGHAFPDRSNREGAGVLSGGKLGKR